MGYRYSLPAIGSSHRNHCEIAIGSETAVAGNPDHAKHDQNNQAQDYESERIVPGSTIQL